MTFTPKIASIVFAGATALAPTAWAAQNDSNNTHHPASATQIAQAAAPAGTTPMMPGMSGMPGRSGMPGTLDMDQQMQVMQAMHEKIMAAKTPAERQALMNEQMKVMQDGMAMMHRMGRGPMGAKPGDMGNRQGMMEQRMDMMQSMMQMMMDRMSTAPADK